MLYRLTTSRHADRFLLKGALLFTLWYDMPHRATRDADLLGFGENDVPSLMHVFGEVAAMVVANGIMFDPHSIAAEPIRKETGYGGVRVTMGGDLAGARCKTQIDVGFGDAVTPEPVEAVYPVLLSDLPAPRLRAYPAYTVVAGKRHAIVLLGMTNTRLKDYFDLRRCSSGRRSTRRCLRVPLPPPSSGVASPFPVRPRQGCRSNSRETRLARRYGRRSFGKTNSRPSLRK